MYLAYNRRKGQLKYTIRQSHFNTIQGVWEYHDVFDLGEAPARYIHRLTENALYFDERLESAVEKEVAGDPTTLLEHLLWDFLPEEERRVIRNFERKKAPSLSQLSEEESNEVERFVHMFDRRRLYFIRYGAVDQGRIFRLNNKLYRPLLFKSRDEKEFYFRRMERSLRPIDLKKYVFAIFNLQEGFEESFSTFMPEALDLFQMERVFIERICGLSDDVSFWQDSVESSTLRQHLIPYLIYFFDYDFDAPAFEQDFVRSFRARHRTFQWPEKKIEVAESEISEIFGRGMEKLRKMNGTELTRLFREKAKDHHPDSGGEAEKFIKLRQVYEQLRKRKG